MRIFQTFELWRGGVELGFKLQAYRRRQQNLVSRHFLLFGECAISTSDLILLMAMHSLLLKNKPGDDNSSRQNDEEHEKDAGELAACYRVI